MRPLLALALLAAAAPTAVAQSTTTVADSSAAVGLIEGVVTDSETGAPLMGAGVMIPALGIGAVSDREGRFTIEGVPPGRHAVRAGAYTYHMTVFDVDVATGQPASLDAALRPGAGVGCAVVHDHDETGGVHGSDG